MIDARGAARLFTALSEGKEIEALINPDEWVNAGNTQNIGHYIAREVPLRVKPADWLLCTTHAALVCSRLGADSCWRKLGREVFDACHVVKVVEVIK